MLGLSLSASADWVKVKGATDASSEHFTEGDTIRQTGPMNTMRRVWQLTHLAKGGSNQFFSIKQYMEYDCRTRRVRVLEESQFSEYWAQGTSLVVMGPDMQPGQWSDIGKSGLGESIFKRVCPHDDSDASKD